MKNFVKKATSTVLAAATLATVAPSIENALQGDFVSAKANASGFCGDDGKSKFMTTSNDISATKRGIENSKFFKNMENGDGCCIYFHKATFDSNGDKVQRMQMYFKKNDKLVDGGHKSVPDAKNMCKRWAATLD